MKEKLTLIAKQQRDEFVRSIKRSYMDYIIMAGVNLITSALVIAVGYAIGGYFQAKAIDNAVDRVMQPIDAIHQKVDIVINDVAEITNNAKKITGKIKAVDIKKVTPSAVKEAISKAPQAKALPRVQDIRDYWRKSTTEKKN